MLILVVEFIGLTSVLPYGLMLPFFTASSGSKGLPIDDGRVVLPADKRFNVHILVPCYKVSRQQQGWRLRSGPAVHPDAFAGATVFQPGSPGSVCACATTLLCARAHSRFFPPLHTHCGSPTHQRRSPWRSSPTL